MCRVTLASHPRRGPLCISVSATPWRHHNYMGASSPSDGNNQSSVDVPVGPAPSVFSLPSSLPPHSAHRISENSKPSGRSPPCSLTKKSQFGTYGPRPRKLYFSKLRPSVRFQSTTVKLGVDLLRCSRNTHLPSDFDSDHPVPRERGRTE